jgi:uncharacterized protein (DUF58 family)
MPQLDLQQVRQTSSLDLLARQLVEGFITGLHRSPYHGFSVEFAEHRLYNAGESTRHIDWKVYARTDKLFTKRYEEETNLRCHLLLDNSSSMFYPTQNKGKLTFAVTLAACLAYLLQRQRDAFGLNVFNEGLELQTEVKSSASHLQKVLVQLQQLLDSTTENSGTSLPETIHHIAATIPKRSLVVLFSDMFARPDQTEALIGALQHLRHNQHEVLVFHITEPQTEREFQFDDRPHEFIDMESGEKLKLNPADIREHYAKSMTAYYNELKIKCLQLKVDFIEADINQDIYQLFVAYLQKRSKMR